jgi:hypothetical protein
LTVIFTPAEGQLSIGLGGHEWVDAAVSGMIGLVAVPPVLLGTAYGIWKENQLDKEVWQVIDERVSALTDAGPQAPTSPLTRGPSALTQGAEWSPSRCRPAADQGCRA